MHRVPERHVGTCSCGFLVWDIGRDPCGFGDLSHIDKDKGIAESASYLPIEIMVMAHGWEYSTMDKSAGIRWPQLRWSHTYPQCLPTGNTSFASYLTSFSKPQLVQLWSGDIGLTLQHTLHINGQLDKLLGWPFLPLILSLWNCASVW